MGELRDRETITTAITAAETGHLILGTLHTNDAKQSINRILDTFPSDAQGQVRIQIASSLICVVSQRLIKRLDGKGRVAALEVMINTPTVKKMIEDWEQNYPDRSEIIFTSLKNIHPSHLYDKTIYDFNAFSVK